MLFKNKIDIFGEVVEIHCDISAISEVIAEEFSIYPTSDKLPTVVLKILDEIEVPYPIIKSPSSHYTFDNGFAFNSIIGKASFRKGEIIEIFLEPLKLSNWKKHIKKFKSIDFTTFEERIGQNIHELLLVPMVYFDSSKALIHASAVMSADEEVILIGGTGGVGKTALEIQQCLFKGYKFIADDISVVNDSGEVYPNLSFPKIYGYNLSGNSKLKTKLFAKRGMLDMLFWNLRKRFKGIDKVRRRVNPTTIYQAVRTEKKISKYYFLTRKSVDEIQIQKVDTHKAADMTINIIMSEYFVFNKQLYWHNYNSSVLGKTPLLDLTEVIKNWRKNLISSFETIDCFVVAVPLNIKHNDFLDSLSDIINSNEK
jgi:hypothetical protein